LLRQNMEKHKEAAEEKADTASTEEGEKEVAAA
jgi:hypothetical protein